MDSNNLNLQPCPFCGAPAFTWRTKWDIYIECSKYHADKHRVMVSGKTEKEAEKRWNERSNN